MFSTAFDLVLFALSLVSLSFALVIVLFVSYQQARRKGYRPPAAALIILAGWAVGIAATVLRHPAESTSHRFLFLFLVDFFWLPLLFSALTTAVFILALPRRPLRMFGNRQVKFPFVRVGQALIGLGAALCVITPLLWLAGQRDLTLTQKVSNGFLVLVSCAAFVLTFVVPTGIYLIRRGRRLAAQAVDEHPILDDPRPLVLYLRAFKQEKQFFVIGYKSQYGAYAKSWHARVSGDDQKIGITFEEYLSDALLKSIGRFVALGSPGDYLAPEGASRIYAKDTDWTEKLDLLVQRSICILVEMGKSDNLRWEFEHLRREGLQQKMFVITRPSTEGSAFQWAFWGLLWRLRGIRSVSRQEFSEDLAKLGYDLGTEDSGPGSVITFDADGRGILLTTRADRPVEFVEPIRAWIATGEKVGRHLLTTCPKCGRKTYTFTAGVQELCRDCQEGSPANRTWSRIAPSVYLVGVFALFIGFIVAAVIWVPEGSWIDRHIGGLVTALFVSMLAAFFFVMVRKEQSANRKASQSAAAKDGSSSTVQDRARQKRTIK